MVHVAIVSPPYAGHYNPLQALAGALVDRGHRCTFFQQADAAALMRDERLGFVAVGADSHPPGQLTGVVRRIGALRGVFGIGGLLRDLAASTDMLCRALPAAFRGAGVEAVIGDGSEAAGGLVARLLKLPLITVACALPLNTEPGVPPPFLNWPYDPSPAGMRRNQRGHAIARLVSWRMRRMIAAHAAVAGLRGLSDIEDTLSDTLQLSQLVAALDFPRVAAPTLRYVGPLRTARDAVLPELPARYAYVTLGTLQGNRARLFATIVTACAGAGLACVLVHGGRLSAAQIARLPGSPLCFDFLPQPAAMRRASLVITHGGLNTVMDALTCGLPLAIIPLAFEQAAIGARVARAGVGVVTSPARLAGMIPAALQCRAAAVRMAAQIASAGGIRLAADLIQAELIEARARDTM